MKYIFNLILLIIMLIIGGFFYYLYTIPKGAFSDFIDTDAIIVLTGASGRIETGLSLLCKNPEKKLLITGIHSNLQIKNINLEFCNLSHTNLNKIRKNIYLERESESTIRNAIETRKWIEKHNIKSITIVTSDFHIPRAESEFKNIIKNITIKTYPHYGEIIKTSEWWNKKTMRFLLFEYYKYLLHVINRVNYIYAS